MNVPNLRSITTLFVSICVLATLCPGQGTSANGKNNPYSPSPSGRSNGQTVPIDRVRGTYLKPARTEVERSDFVITEVGSITNAGLRPILMTEGPTAVTGSTTLSLTETYLIGIGDVLLINLKNSPQGTGRYVVRDDGTIDFALAGPTVSVLRKTTDAVSAILRSGIKLFSNPQVDVKIAEYRSHTVTISGLAENTGEKSLRREALPLFTLRAEAEVSRDAKRVSIKRAGSNQLETFDLNDSSSDGVLVFPGDSVEFLPGIEAKDRVSGALFR